MVVRSRRTRKGSNRGHKKRSYRRNYRKYNRKSNTRKKSKKSNMRKTRKMKGGMSGTGVILGARRGSSRGPALEPEPEPESSQLTPFLDEHQQAILDWLRGNRDKIIEALKNDTKERQELLAKFRGDGEGSGAAGGTLYRMGTEGKKVLIEMIDKYITEDSERLGYSTGEEYVNSLPPGVAGHLISYIADIYRGMKMSHRAIGNQPPGGDAGPQRGSRS